MLTVKRGSGDLKYMKVSFLKLVWRNKDFPGKFGGGIL